MVGGFRFPHIAAPQLLSWPRGFCRLRLRQIFFFVIVVVQKAFVGSDTDQRGTPSQRRANDRCG